MKEKPNYYAIIPANVRYDKSLKANEKLLYAEIVALSNKDGYCYASNKYFSELYEVSIQSISSWINNLIEKGYIESEIIYKENTKEIDYRKLSTVLKKSLIGIKEIFKGGIKENFNRGIKENFKGNNINNNNINNNIKENIKRKYFDNEKLNELFIEFLELRIKLKCKNTDRAINLLINELNKYDDEIKIDMINNSIMNSWKSVYPLKKEKKHRDSEEEVLKYLEEMNK